MLQIVESRFLKYWLNIDIETSNMIYDIYLNMYIYTVNPHTKLLHTKRNHVQYINQPCAVDKPAMCRI